MTPGRAGKPTKPGPDHWGGAALGLGPLGKTLGKQVLKAALPKLDVRSNVKNAAQSALSQVAQRSGASGAAQTLGQEVNHWRAAARQRADVHLEHLIERSRAERGEVASPDVQLALQRRRAAFEQQQRQQAAKVAFLAQARTPQEQRVLQRVVLSAPWAGGTQAVTRYTQLLDTLAPSGNAESEMALHRALWTLAERRVVAVSPHGEITACALPTPEPSNR